jgi:His-Xaa-Ser system protein HxsD
MRANLKKYDGIMPRQPAKFHVSNGFEGAVPMTWPVTLKLDSAAYPAEARLTLSPEQAHSLILQHLNDFALRDQINRETAGLREVLARAALTGCGISQ